jgi:cell division protein FtsL
VSGLDPPAANTALDSGARRFRTARAGRARISDLLPSLCLGGLVLLAALFYVWQHIQVVRLGYEIERLQGDRLALLREEKALRFEIARLTSLHRVEEIARRQLGLTSPAPGQVILVESP